MMRTIATIFAFFICFNLTLNAQVSPQDSLAAYYPFSGNANDESGNGNDGTVHGATLTHDRFGNLNNAYSFDGVDDYIECGDLSIFGNSFSVSLWIYFEDEDLNETKRIIGKGLAPDAYTYSWSLNVKYDNSISFFWESPDDADHLIYSSSQIQTNKYYHLVILLDTDNNKFSIYINGVLEATMSMSSLPGQNDDNLIIGARQGVDGMERHFKGHIDDIRVFNRVLDEDDITYFLEESNCSGETNITSTYYVSDSDFQETSPNVYLDSTKTFTTESGFCDSIVNYYTEFVFDANHCTDTNIVTVVDSISVTDTLIIDVQLGSQTPPDDVNTIKIYPNPANEYVIINTGNYNLMTDYNLQIVNALGQTVFESFMNQAEFQINVNDFDGLGTYFINVFDDQDTLLETRKLILQ